MTLKGKYKILSELGEGGFGTVYKAEDISLGRTVALKVMKSNLALNDSDVARIKTEAQLLAKLMHPNIVTVYALEMLEDNIPVVVMEYIEGKTLDMRINEGSMNNDCFNDVLSQVCAGLNYAHENRVVHRDLSPRNILLIEHGNRTTAKIIDFGLSKLIKAPDTQGQKHSTTTVTATGYLVGNPQYMSPEVCLGMKADSQSDIYSLGCIFYEMLCGHAMFADADPIGILYKQQHEYPPIPELYWDAQQNEQIYQDATLLCLQKDREKRPKSAAEIIALVEDRDKLQSRISKAARWQNDTAAKSSSNFGFALVACFAVLAICGAAIGLSTKKVKTEPVPLGHAPTKRVSSKSVFGTLMKVQRLIVDTPPGTVESFETLKQTDKELEQLISSKNLNPTMKFLAYQYRANIAMLEPISSEEKFAALNRCIPYSLTADGQDTHQTATVLFHMAMYAPKQADAQKYLKRAIAVYDKDERNFLEIPKEFRTPVNTITPFDICSSLGRAAYEAGNTEEALKWLHMGVQRSSLDPNWRLQPVTLEAEYLNKLGRKSQARASIEALLKQLSDSAAYDPGNTVFSLAASENIKNILKLGDWCAKNGFVDIAKKSYSRAITLIDQTDINKNLKPSAAEKLDALANRK